MIITAVIVVVAAVIGMAVINEIMKSSANLDTSTQNNQNWTTKVLSPCGHGITSLSLYNATGSSTAYTENTHYSLVKKTCTLSNLTAAIWQTNYNVTYVYADDETYTSALSRTIAGYVVPIGLLGTLALAIWVAL